MRFLNYLLIGGFFDFRFSYVIGGGSIDVGLERDVCSFVYIREGFFCSAEAFGLLNFRVLIFNISIFLLGTFFSFKFSFFCEVKKRKFIKN